MIKLKKKLKNFSKRTIAMVALLAMVSSCFIPVFRVLADPGDNNSGEYVVSFGLDNHGFTVNSVTVNGAAWTNSDSDRYKTADDRYTIVISVDKKGDDIPDIGWGGNWNGFITKSFTNEGNTYTYTVNVNDQNHQGFIGLEINPKVEEQGNEPHFDGKAYVVWSCGNGTCYHYFNDIPPFDDGNSTFYKATDVTADNNTSISFDVKARYKGWVLPDSFDRWVNAYKQKYNVSEVDWDNVNPEGIIGNPPDMREWEDAAIEAKACTKVNTPQDDFERCVDEYYTQHSGNLPFIKLQPVGEPEDNNAYVSYGDRNFKVVIYNDSFKGITMGDLSDLHYYPASWANPFVMRDQFDLSGSTKDKPAVIDSILLEDTVKIKSLNYNSFAIASIEALDVPEDAVAITKDNNGDFRLVFSSNFYDNVLFKVKDTSGETSYLRIKRYTVDAWINNVENEPHLYAELYFDKTKSHSDFDLTARIEYKDGTTENVVLTAYDKIDDGLGNITTAYEVDESVSPDPEHVPAGKGLKKSVFIYKLPNGKTDRDIKKAYVNVEYKGSTETNYAGAFAGSGKGILANIYQGEEE